MATKTKTTGNKRKTIKELQYHIDCDEKTIRNGTLLIMGLILAIMALLIVPYIN